MTVEPQAPLRLRSARGFRVELPPHPHSCELEALQEHAARTPGRPLAVDLFCGAGGLSLGLEEAGFEVILGVDHDPESIATHRSYFGGASLQGDLSDPNLLERIGDALAGITIDLLAGGPPCQPFSRAGKNKIRSLLQQSIWEGDDRRELWQGFMYVVNRVKPAAVLVENVPELAIGDDAFVLRKLVDALEESGYDVYSRVVGSWQYGVPQFRSRLILVAMRAGQSFQWPTPTISDLSDPRVSLRHAIEDLKHLEDERGVDIGPYPQVASGFELTAYQERCRNWRPRGLVLDQDEMLFQHITRAVRADDLEAFRAMAEGGKYTDVPEELRRYRSDVFDDKYNRLWWDRPSRTITAHLAKDGYWYIHPEYHRTLSVREAARLQSFPDRFRFIGTPTRAYRQIGEAVPPLLGQALGEGVLNSLGHPAAAERASTRQIAATLQQWLTDTSDEEMVAPWRRCEDLWHVLLGTVLFEKLRPAEIRAWWPTYREFWATPQDFLDDPKARNGLSWLLKRRKISPSLESIAQALVSQEEAEPTTLRIPGMSPDRLGLALAVVGAGHRLPVTAAGHRVAERVFGEHTSDSRVTGQLLLARLVGVDDHGRAFAAVLEIGDRFCFPDKPACNHCPLQSHCQTGRQAPPLPPDLFEKACDAQPVHSGIGQPPKARCDLAAFCHTTTDTVAS